MTISSRNEIARNNIEKLRALAKANGVYGYDSDSSEKTEGAISPTVLSPDNSTGSSDIRVIGADDTVQDVITNSQNIIPQGNLLSQNTGIGSLNSSVTTQEQQTQAVVRSGNNATTTAENSGSYGNTARLSQKESMDKALSASSGTEDTEGQKAPGTNSAIENQLSGFASHNCIFTFGVLSKNSINDARNNYRKKGSTYTIIRSGGGGIDNNRVTTAFDEDGQNGNLEYFIDDFNMQAILSPNQRTGMSSATKFSFKVFEPYSLGLFLQSLRIAAERAGYTNYLEAPYMLELDFLGYDDDNKSYSVEYANRKFPMKLVSVQFNVDQGGSVYDVEAIPWNDQTLSDSNQKIKDPVSLSGSTVSEVLSFGGQSLTAIINERNRKVAEEDELPAHDLYVIRFPKSRTRPGTESVTSDNPDGATVSTEAQNNSTVISTDQFESRISTFFGNLSSSTNDNIYQSLVGSATTDVNKIGASLLADNFNKDTTSQPFPRGLYTYDEEAQIYRRDGIELSLKDNERIFTFPQGMTIQKIIEEMVLISNYGQLAVNNVDNEGMITWFKVEVECYVLNSPQVEQATGATPKVFVYNVVPYRVHTSINSSPNKGIKGADPLSKQVTKQYEYIYSGNNDDVLRFDIQFNTAFFEALRADNTTRSNGERAGSQNTQIQADETPSVGVDSSPGDQPANHQLKRESVTGEYTGGSVSSSSKQNIAKQFHNILLNSNVDLITANVEIWGDPYYLPDTGMGNYTAKNSGVKATLTEDGTIDYQRNEVDILVNFRTPIDYGSNGLMDFGGPTKDVSGFSGFYKVITIDSTISGNRFTQTLELVRRKNQTLDGVSEANAQIEKANIPNENSETKAGQTGRGTNTPGANPRANNNSASAATSTPGANPREGQDPSGLASIGEAVIDGASGFFEGVGEFLGFGDDEDQPSGTQQVSESNFDISERNRQRRANR